MNRLEDFNNIEKTLDLLKLLNDFEGFMKKNIEIVSQYIEILDNFFVQIRINLLLKEKEKLLKELEITEEFEKSSDIAAMSDLLDKLNKSLIDNKRKLKYLEEDYNQRKNQIDQLSNTIKNYKAQIQELTKKKKEYFTQINRIAREMSGDPSDKEGDSNFNLEINGSLSNAQKIRVFQKKAKEVQSNINDLNMKVEETNVKFKEFNPLYKSYKQDYDKLKKIIETDEKRIEELELELKMKVIKEKINADQSYNKLDFKSIRSKNEIKNALNRNKDELETISTTKNSSIIENPDDLAELIKNFTDLNDYLKNNQKEIRISKNEEEIKQIIESFQKFEILLDELESIINVLLSQINLKSNFSVLLSIDNKRFFIQIGFTRNNKEKTTFEELTTPEKIFFIIIYIISIEIQLRNQNILFSNLFIPTNYNKAGSIFRTIRKILPLFENEEDFSNYNLIFILSNLEMKKEIKNVKIITIKENG
ncbi:MAG: hypothetical protein ACFFBE_17375 [Promethearchaeota archaeon]